jgi:hypothetical protein
MRPQDKLAAVGPIRQQLHVLHRNALFLHDFSSSKVSLAAGWNVISRKTAQLFPKTT